MTITATGTEMTTPRGKLLEPSCAVCCVVFKPILVEAFVSSGELLVDSVLDAELSDVAGKLENVDIFEENVETFANEVCDADNDIGGENEFGGNDANDDDVCGNKAGVTVDVIADVMMDEKEDADNDFDGLEELETCNFDRNEEVNEDKDEEEGEDEEIFLGNEDNNDDFDDKTGVSVVVMTVVIDGRLVVDDIENTDDDICNDSEENEECDVGSDDNNVVIAVVDNDGKKVVVEVVVVEALIVGTKVDSIVEDTTFDDGDMEVISNEVKVSVDCDVFLVDGSESPEKSVVSHLLILADAE